MRRTGQLRIFAVALTALSVAGGSVTAVAGSADDRARAVNVVAPGESGFISLPTFLQVTAGTSSSYGPNFADQLPLYAGWRYKPFQFLAGAGGTHPGGDTHVSITRDANGVPAITADDDLELAYGMGYAMAQDRLFQMEVFRRVGHGTLAELTGASGLAMDKAVRQLSEGVTGRAAELAAAPAFYRNASQRFSDGVNRVISEVTQDPTRMPAEFVLLNDLPIKPWTPDDTLAFGEYAGRFFGEFGHSEISAAKTYAGLVASIGQPAAEKVYGAIFRLDDPDAPSIIAPADGLFPRHTAPAAASSFAASPYANHDPSLLPPAASLNAAFDAVYSQVNEVRRTQRRMGLPDHFGSNAIVVAGSRTASGNPILYSGPQTGWAVPGFFWEMELKTPARHSRGVTVPAIPLMVIGRNEDSAWSVTSALDGNSDTFVEQLSADNTQYLHNGQWLAVQSHTETINCNNPPTAVLPLLSGVPPTLCPLTPTQVTEYRTLHGPALTVPDASHHLYVRQSTVDGHLVDTFQAWDKAGQQHTAASFGDALSNNYLGFNFFYADGAGEIAYFRTGRWPIRPVNVDPNLPLPGTGAYDWQGFERYADTPHVINPSTGYLVNWNNKPAKGWFSKGTDTTDAPPTADIWGDGHQVEALDDAVRAAPPLTLEAVGQLPKAVAYRDVRADRFLPYLVPVLRASGDATLVKVADALAAWDHERVDGGDHKLHTAPTFFDRWIEHLTKNAFSGPLGNNWATVAGLQVPPPCRPNELGHYVSCDNEDVPTMKVELATVHTLLENINGTSTYDFFGGARDAAMTTAARDAVTELGGGDPANWNEPVETGAWTAQGAGAADTLSPLPDRGSYGQVVEPLTAGLTRGTGGLPNTAGFGLPAVPVALLALVLALGARVAPRRPGHSRLKVMQQLLGLTRYSAKGSQ